MSSLTVYAPEMGERQELSMYKFKRPSIVGGA